MIKYLWRGKPVFGSAPDTQADLTERARVPVEKWFGRPGGYDHPMLPDVAAFGKSEREAAAAEARTECYQLLHHAFGEIEIAIFHGRDLASPPAPQEETNGTSQN